MMICCRFEIFIGCVETLWNKDSIQWFVTDYLNRLYSWAWDVYEMKGLCSQVVQIVDDWPQASNSFDVGSHPDTHLKC